MAIKLFERIRCATLAAIEEFRDPTSDAELQAFDDHYDALEATAAGFDQLQAECERLRTMMEHYARMYWRMVDEASVQEGESLLLPADKLNPELTKPIAPLAAPSDTVTCPSVWLPQEVDAVTSELTTGEYVAPPVAPRKKKAAPKAAPKKAVRGPAKKKATKRGE